MIYGVILRRAQIHESEEAISHGGGERLRVKGARSVRQSLADATDVLDETRCDHQSSF